MNSAFAWIPCVFKDGGRIWAPLLITTAFSTSTLTAQQETELPNRSLQIFPNPFRTNSSNSKASAEQKNGDLRSTTSASIEGRRHQTPVLRSEIPNNLVDVIRLASLPSQIEPPVVTAISVSPKGDMIAAAGDDHAIRIVDLATGTTTATLTGHLDWVQSLEFSPNGLLLASCGNDGTLRVWSLGSSPKLLSKRSVSHALMALTFLNDDCIFVAGFSNRIYRYSGGQPELAIFHACDCRDIRTIATSPDQKWIAFGGRDGVLRMRRTDMVENENGSHSDPSNELTTQLHFDRIRSLQFSVDGNQITSVGEDRRIVHFDVINRTVVGQTEIGGGKLLGLCQLEPHLFAIASSDNTIRIFSDTAQQVHSRLVGHDGSVSVLKRTQKHLISGSFDTTIRIWHIDGAMASIDNQGRYVHPVAAQFEDSGAGESVR
ncbi:MAG TPA: hypothetical protein VM260_14065 [Pirellula sp.]|nr:hypothetical protein [Pirellula sp.]